MLYMLLHKLKLAELHMKSDSQSAVGIQLCSFHVHLVQGLQPGDSNLRHQ
jgi:hypothetical protein